MIEYIIRRLLLALLVMFVISLVSFTLLKSSGDLATSMGATGGAEYVEFLRKEYGFDKPLHVQYFKWLSNALSGDFGRSYYFNEGVAKLLLGRIATTLTLGGMAMLIALSLSLLLGIASALRPGGWVDHGVQTFTLVGQALPVFWFSYLLIYVLGIQLGLLPVSGADGMIGLVMPAIALAINASPTITRILRLGMIETLRADYIRTARAKGLTETAVILKHSLRNALTPVVAVAAVQFGSLLAGSIVVETIFAVDGVGYLTWQAITQNDYPVVQASILVVSSIYVLMTLLSDLINMIVDPRVRM